MNTFQYFLFSCGQIGMMTLNRFFLQWIVVYAALQEDGHALFPATTVGALLLGFRIFDGITDPMAGRLSDVWIRKGQERRTLLWFSFLVPSIGLILTFLPNHGMEPALRWSLTSSGMFLFFVGYTFFAIPFWSLIGDYAPGNEPRRRVLSNLLGSGLLVATAIGFVVSPILIDKLGYTMAAIILSAIAAVMMALPYFAAPADRFRPSKDHADSPTAAGESEAALTVKDSLLIAFKHRRFLGLMALYSGSQMSFTIMTTAAPFIAIHLLKGSEGDVAKLLGPLLLVAFPCFLLVPRFSAKVGWERGMVVGSIALAVVYSSTAALGVDLIASPMVTAGLLFSLGGPMVALLLGLEPEGVAACATERGGEHIIGIYMGIFNFVVKILNGIAIFIAAALVGYSETIGVIAIRAMSLVAGGCLILGVVGYYCIRPRES
ncbi:MAG: MFS transporter [Verrucomicrobia bacterium]|nr:MFS transporter [Verrucomicrobiota bacterium]